MKAPLPACTCMKWKPIYQLVLVWNESQITSLCLYGMKAQLPACTCKEFTSLYLHEMKAQSHAARYHSIHCHWSHSSRVYCCTTTILSLQSAWWRLQLQTHICSCGRTLYSTWQKLEAALAIAEARPSLQQQNCHLFWQNDRGLLRATMVTWGSNGHWIRAQSESSYSIPVSVTVKVFCITGEAILSNSSNSKTGMKYIVNTY